MDELEAWLEDHGAVSVRRAPHLLNRIRSGVRAGRLVRVLHGTYVPAGAERDWRTLASAAVQHDPRNVIVGAAAAALTYWRERPVSTVAVASPVRPGRVPGFDFRRQFVDPHHVVGQVATDAWAAVDLMPQDGPSAVDRLRRSRVVNKKELQSVLASMPGRRGNAERAALIAADAWSEAERMAHEQLISAGIGGWYPNCELHLGDDSVFADLWFPRARLVGEIDGWEFHGTREAFEKDRFRDSALLRHGIRSVRITWEMLCNPDYLPDLVRGLLHRRRRRAV
ncbi:PDDEXK family nuclease [Parenemella sanctibonifatiensis]|uniref:DUF559 domain-containing protein n=1 Tax=Parenemella sanctibonifatiensis TaxID=2016505 RepID=A0A255EAN0_9ACTN|nr:hypothetical protein [Parenemella sanctibonifatiensis]OYN88618.1 hypothetical protein CGZ91_13510 [Parenemella sanctibonifatiensis]